MREKFKEVSIELESFRENKDEPPKASGITYTDIISYNNYEDLSEGVEQLTEIYGKLFEYGLWLSGFQFVGLAVEDSEEMDSLQEVANFILTLGLCVSIFSCLIAFITLNYLRGIQSESNLFIFLGLQKFKHIFKIADCLLFLSTVLFAAAINLIVYTFKS